MPDFLTRPRNESLANGGKTSAPAANAALATLATPAAGYYQVDIYTGLSGTLAAVDASNFEFRKGSTPVAVLATSGSGASGVNGSVGPFTFFVNLNGATSITVNATAASTAGSVYHCTMIATLLS